jgi:membrane-associated PAP2 superfamily phosphatase
MGRGRASANAAAPGEAGWLTSALLVVVLGWDASGMDVPLASLAGSAAGFPWREHWLLADVLHDGGRRVAWLLALVLCLGVWWPVRPLARLGQGERLQLAVTTLLAALAVSVLKAGSHTSCPWELHEFGGFARYASHWSLLADGGGGRCFPAGHAASGFSFMGGYLVFRRTDARAARVWLAGAVGAGLLLGIAQQWRGAHFMSHTLWSAAICWIAACVVDATWPRAWRLEQL